MASPKKVGIAFVWSSKDLQIWESGRVRRAVTSALRKGGSDGLRAMRAEASRRIRANKRFRLETVKPGLALDFPPKNADLRRLAWTLKVSGTEMPLFELPHRRAARGVSVTVNKGKGKVLEGGFIRRLKSGHEGIFLRKGKGRLPIREAFTTRLSDVLRDSGASDQVLTRGVERMSATIKRLLSAGA